MRIGTKLPSGLANMSHELRTPLNSLLILSKMLFENHGGNLTARQVEYAKTIYSSGCDLLTMINDMLDLAKMESGKMEVTPSRLYIEDLIDFTEKSFRPLALVGNIGFHIQLQEGLPSYIISDEKRLQQVLNNLLSNAFKFTEQGEVSLEIGAVDGLSNRIYFAVKDTGIGIAKEKQAHIFEAFQQADGTISRKYGGTGLGLSICREISALLGGEITVESEEGKGSTFTFLAGDYQGAEEAVNDASILLDEAAVPIEITEQDDLKGKRVLLVDDDVRSVFALTDVLERTGMSVKFARNGIESLKALQEEGHFDMILMDMMMPGMDGYEAMQKWRKNPDNDSVPVIALTEKAMKEDREKCTEAGASDYIVKPVDPDRLISLIRVWLER